MRVGLNITRETVETVIGRVLPRGPAQLLDWQYQPFGIPTGQATRGVFRFWGTASESGQEVPWSAVLKMIAAPGPDAPSFFNDESHPLYWKREILAYQSGLLDGLPDGLRAVRCLQATEQEDGSFHLWLEEATDLYGQRWPLEQYAQAARALGRFNGSYLTTRPLPAYPWLVQSGSPRGILDHNMWLRDVLLDPKTWRHSLVQVVFPASMAEHLLALWADRHFLLDALDRVPATLCHLDAWRGNLFAPEGIGGGMVAIDWAFPGKAAVGTDAGDLFAPSFGMLRVEPTTPYALDETIFESYLEGLREVGWTGKRQVVRFAFTAFAALKYACFTPWLAHAQDESKSDVWEALSGVPMADFLRNQAVLLDYLLRLADEARGLVESI